jgi:[lysine-biosynthesis-protein LysW]---L-2-aminoadipate ligase
LDDQRRESRLGASSRSVFVGKRLERPSPGKVWVVAEGHSNLTNELLVGALHERGVPAGLVRPASIGDLACPGDIVLGRLDVRPTLDGVEGGIWELRRVERRGVLVLNPAPSLVTCHDKLQTLLRLAALGVSQPATSHVDGRGPSFRVDRPVVVKPRFGSWGRDVFLCESHAELVRCLARLRERKWFRRHGALVQVYVPSTGFDLRVVVAGGEVVGAVQRLAAEGEWRTNVALGGTRLPATPPVEACALAVAAAAAVGGDLVGVDLLPLPEGGWVVLEVNGAVDFTSDYSLRGHDVFDAVAARLMWAGAASGAGVAQLGG